MRGMGKKLKIWSRDWRRSDSRIGSYEARSPRPSSPALALHVFYDCIRLEPFQNPTDTDPRPFIESSSAPQPSRLTLSSSIRYIHSQEAGNALVTPRVAVTIYTLDGSPVCWALDNAVKKKCPAGNVQWLKMN
ncbi:hypothetical protein EVAR_53153_1 [Eumeta japonica]|uniref:Uncharacterized protein n=1 Tax=Eumeta variegata TaxID=151549 RepID=A0A4C1YBJ6_EUMVA|nr:hypothetical protein EVAR_53153_1 [Eumeta japonica]